MHILEYSINIEILLVINVGQYNFGQFAFLEQKKQFSRRFSVYKQVKISIGDQK